MLALALGLASAVALASCGGGSSSDLLPGTTANQITSNLDEVQRLVDEGDCVGAEDAVAEVTQEVEELQEVDLKLKAALEEGSRQLSEVVGECEETASEETEPTLEPDVEAEEVEEEKKPKKEKPEKKGEQPEEPEEPSEDEGPESPPPGKGEEKGQGGEPGPSEESEEPSSGGVGPGVGVEE